MRNRGLILVGYFIISGLLLNIGRTSADSRTTCPAPTATQSIQQVIWDTSCDIVQIAAGQHTGNLRVDRAVTIEGASASTTIIDGNLAGTVFTVFGDGNATIKHLTIQRGDAAQTGGQGGGIYNESTVALEDVRIINNKAESGAGIMNHGGITIINSEISGNQATTGAGGIEINAGATAVMTNVTVSGNQGSNGAGMAVGGSLTILNSTIANNTDIHAVVDSVSLYGTMTAKNSIFSANTAVNCYGTGTLHSQGGNLFSDSSCAAGSGDQANVNPQLQPLASNGGTTYTHALSKTSPAVDKGVNSGCPATDQRGVGRPIDGNGSGTATCDVGAYEAPLPNYTIFLPTILR